MAIMRLFTDTFTYSDGITLYQPYDVIDDYDSLVWAERYRVAGDFTLVFKQNVDARFDDLQEDGLIAVPDSDVPMVIESKVIEEDEDGNDVLTITGRTFETLQEGRVARPQTPSRDPKTYGTDPWPLANFGSDVPNDWTLRISTGGMAQQLLAYWTIRVAADGNKDQYNLAIPNYAVTGILPFLPTRSFLVQPGTIYERLLEVLAIDDLGVKTSRPTSDNGLTAMTTYVYGGIDQSDRVVMSSAAGHFKKASYGFSSKDRIDTAWNFSADKFNKSAKISPTWFKAIGYNAMTDIKTEDATSRPDSWDQYDAMAIRGAAYLRDHQEKKLVACVLADSIPYRFNYDFYLGDLVRVMGKYGVDQKMRVAEYIRVEDQNGKRAYPTLSLPGEDLTSS